MITSPQEVSARTEYVLKLIIVIIIILVLIVLLPLLAIKTSEGIAAHKRLQPEPIPDFPIKNAPLPKHVQQRLELADKIFSNPEVRLSITVPKSLRTAYKKLIMLD